MSTKEMIEKLQSILDKIYDPITGKKRCLSPHRYEQIYEIYEDLEKRYQYALGEERPPEYGEDDLYDLLDDVCAGLA